MASWLVEPPALTARQDFSLRGKLRVVAVSSRAQRRFPWTARVSQPAGLYIADLPAPGPGLHEERRSPL